MSLPIEYIDTKNYLKDALKFLFKYKWLFSIPNTHILVKNIFNNFKEEWMHHLQSLSCEELKNIPFDFIKDSWPDSLKEFLVRLNSLKPKLDNFEDIATNDLPKNWFDGVSNKKKYEILAFAPIIHKYCSESDILIDIGSGLGYLPQLLYEKYKYKIIGIECDEKKCDAAKMRQEKFYENSKSNITYFQHFINENSASEINSFVENFLKIDSKNVKISIIGLHACADLSITILKLFFEMKNVKNIIIMPCCYHRMKLNNISGDYFVNFPTSKILKEIYEFYNEDFLNVPFLRLACQNSSKKWKKMTENEISTLSINLLRRNVLQLVAEKGGYRLSRLKRKCNKCNDTTTYIKELKNTHTFHDKKNNRKIPIEELSTKITSILSENEHLLYLFKVYCAFQTSIQSICENIILLDRILLILENDVYGAAIQVANDELSPRCFALVAKQRDG